MTCPDRIPEWGREQIAILVNYGCDRGVPSDICFASTALDIRSLEYTDPTKNQEAQVIANLIEALPDHPFELGIDVGRRCNVNTFGVFGKALLASKNIKTATDLTARYLGGELHFNRLRFVIRSRGVFTLFEPVGNYPRPIVQFLLARDMGATIAFHEHILKRVPGLLLEIGFVEDWLPGMEILEQHFDCEVKVKQTENYTLGNTLRHYMTLPFSNRLLYDQFERQLQRFLAPETELPIKRLRKRIQTVVIETGYRSMTREELAKRLNVSTRTLARYLQFEGTTWRQLTTEIRLSRARQLLESSDMAIEGIALAVGFSSASAFSVAFSRQTEMSPLEFRRSCRPLPVEVSP